MGSAGRHRGQQHWGFCTDQHGGIVVLTVCDPLLLLNGLRNNGLHSSHAVLGSRSKRLYLHEVCDCIHVYMCKIWVFAMHFVLYDCLQSACLSVCGLPVTRGACHSSELALNDTVVASFSCWPLHLLPHIHQLSTDRTEGKIKKEETIYKNKSKVQRTKRSIVTNVHRKSWIFRDGKGEHDKLNQILWSRHIVK